MSKETSCDCDDESHKGDVQKGHKHFADECIHNDGKRHKIHKK